MISNSKDCQEVPHGCREMDLQDERAHDGLDSKWIAGWYWDSRDSGILHENLEEWIAKVQKDSDETRDAIWKC